ncbi:(Fe-S)-binding protein [Halanaeroarchaeum sulfurireducens]|uniref:Fe-S oxidoreductase n=1 Tax=Halanaeroarchaeum sulfurireducens TaxID=1604004 RepID=A0A0F7P7D0_9EURY|nr:(Fe-S)-binding protein [Halanaeroarchaeum sulfurireducens]AKH96602.1 Fe-S oxidoreductase [Halanaeroarchaeum sulfurireducens]ALG81004.1 Fe-S oxidoreductase [Halanaeroarchaeum sulfurireducens]
MDALVAVQPDVTRPTFWGIGVVGAIVFYYLAAVALSIFAYGIAERIRSITAGAPEPIERFDALGRRLLDTTKVVATNETVFDRDWFGGLMHALIVWGFLTLFAGTVVLAVDMDLWTPLLGRESFFTGPFYLGYSAVLDGLGLLFVVGVSMALYRRYWVRADRLWGEHTGVEDDLFVWTLWVLGVGGFLLEGVRILGTGMPDAEVASFVGWSVASGLAGLGISEGTAGAVYAPLWWSHAIVALGFVAWLPTAKPVHMLTAPAALLTRDPDAGRRLPGVPADASPETIGYADLRDVTWKHRLDQDACTNCGRCSAVCPATAVGRPLDPRTVVLDLTEYRHAVDAGTAERRPVVAAEGESVIDAETMEACMACQACMDVCPVAVEHLPQFVAMNRRLTETGQLDASLQETLTDLFRTGNAYGEPGRRRPEWTEELSFEVPDAREQSVEYLWYVGDAPSFDDRNRAVARSLARLFEVAGVSYGILYEDERNDGNDVRRVGEEGLFETLAGETVEALRTADFETLVTTDPHAYNTFKNEYEAVGWARGDDVRHYTQVVASLLESGALGLSADELGGTVTYHDPCHLGRYNGEYDAPRAVIDATGATRVEMPRNRADAFCCGGGGGGQWTDADQDVKPSEERLREAVEDTRSGGDVEQFVVACPTCLTMFEDGRKTGGYEGDVDVVDVAELVWEALEERGVRVDD